ncbi:MAG: ATP-binding protein [Thermodesulfobacteriota bacterium]|nr:ATP-binding protein [Thermodesulfobacteriota bacterium]
MLEELGIKRLTEAFDNPNDILEWLNSLDTFVAVLDKDGNLLFCNEAPLILGGTSFEDVVGKYFLDIKHWSHSHTERMKISECIEKGKKIIASRIETNFRSAERKPVQIIFNLKPIINKDGNIKYFTIEGKVIEEEYRLRKELEKMKFELEDRVTQRTNELEKANKSLLQAQKMEAIGRLAGGIAHDFNNMLNVILGCTELIMLKIPTDNSKNSIYSMMKQIEKAVKHSADLTRQLLGFSRMQIIRPRTIEVNRTIAGIEKMISRLIGEDISIYFILGENLWKVYLDPLQIDQLTFNLALNARDSMPKGGKLVIETANVTIDDVFCSQHPEFPRGEFVMISISDNGIGIDQETLPHIFEPFFTTKKMVREQVWGLLRSMEL